MDWILTLALVTFLLVVGFLLWNRSSTLRHHKLGDKASGIGGPSDPLSGNSEGMRHPDALRADLNAAAAKSSDAPLRLSQK